jgi:HSP20 family protein
MPSIDIAESEGQVIIKAEIPGVAPKDLEISLSGNTLYLRGEKQDEREEKGEQYYHVERSFGTFERALELPPGINPEEVNAEYNNGVVTITLKREQGGSRRKIPVVIAKS